MATPITHSAPERSTSSHDVYPPSGIQASEPAQGLAINDNTTSEDTDDEVFRPDDHAELCERCRGIDWEKMLHARMLKHRTEVCHLGDILCVTKTCPVCNFFHDLAGGEEETLQYNRIRSGWIPPLYITNDDEIISGPRFDFVLSTKVRLVEPTIIDFTEPREWIEFCDKNHTTCKPSAVTPKHLIDCNSRRVERMQEHRPYCTLSYVWGSQLAEDSMLDGTLPLSLPATIEDAITCTLAIGMKYLWVDKFCISQQQHDEKALKIGRMDEIYSGAEIGFFAIGEDACAGLAGLSVFRDIKRCRLGKHVLVEMHEKPQQYIRRSKWSQRGWTYQELLLSRRRLFFTPSGVYFECNEHHLTEGKSGAVEHDGGLTTQLTQTRRWDSNPICTHIQAYTKRQLTYPSDSLQAMLGIFNHLAKSQNPEHHYWGIPFLKREHESTAITEFAKGLCWSAWLDKMGGRRPAFPSWSWCGWDHTWSGVRFGIDEMVADKIFIRDLKIILSNGTYTCETIWKSISDPGIAQIPDMRPNYTEAVSPQLQITGLVIHFCARVTPNGILSDVTLGSRPTSTEFLGELIAWMDVDEKLDDELTALTAILLHCCWEDNGYSEYRYILLRELTRASEDQESKQSEQVETVSGIAPCAKYERVGMLKISCYPTTTPFEELDWYTKAKWEEIIIC
ncbi:hypothetical protein FKW77_009289 [Venturia effusa]|uniref:Heterokaryon incompatibility domain-containing protein n=1 Tax=Venturia effusa TaxID=50376 RepID=A0A517LEK1_9PEZI|nr:hypothetical protein FKW77_009289 [Venturia effusa]